MRYLVLIRPHAENSPDQPDDTLMTEMGALIEEMTKAGVLLDTAGLAPAADGTRIRQTGGVQTVLDGPFTESKEVVGGYCLVQTRSQDEAVEWASRFLRVHGPEWDIEVEVRQVAEA